MTFKPFRSALALTALLCLPLAGLSSATAQAGKAEAPGWERTANFNSAGSTASVKKGPARAARKASRPAGKSAARAVKGRNPAIVAKVKAHARAAGVPVSTAMAIVHQESGFRPQVTGSAGEIGLMQLKCQTARGMGFTGSCKALYHPDTNLRFGMKYLKAALKRGSVGYYNAGIHAKSLPAAARKYAASVAANTANDG